jgi:hypothetical protein
MDSLSQTRHMINIPAQHINKQNIVVPIKAPKDNALHRCSSRIVTPFILYTSNP